MIGILPRTCYYTPRAGEREQTGGEGEAPGKDEEGWGHKRTALM